MDIVCLIESLLHICIKADISLGNNDNVVKKVVVTGGEVLERGCRRIKQNYYYREVRFAVRRHADEFVLSN